MINYIHIHNINKQLIGKIVNIYLFLIYKTVFYLFKLLSLTEETSQTQFITMQV